MLSTEGGCKVERHLSSAANESVGSAFCRASKREQTRALLKPPWTRLKEHLAFAKETHEVLGGWVRRRGKTALRPPNFFVCCGAADAVLGWAPTDPKADERGLALLVLRSSTSNCSDPVA